MSVDDQAEAKKFISLRTRLHTRVDKDRACPFDGESYTTYSRVQSLGEDGGLQKVSRACLGRRPGEVQDPLVLEQRGYEKKRTTREMHGSRIIKTISKTEFEEILSAYREN